MALRESRLALQAGDGDAATAHLVRARSLATAAGDSALVQLASVHAALLDIDLGHPVDAAAVAAPIVAWAAEVGSTSWVRGLARLCRCRAERRRDTDAMRARDARRLAEALADGVGAERESALVRREQAVAYGATNLRRAAGQLLLGELSEAGATAGDGPPSGGEAGWGRS